MPRALPRSGQEPNTTPRIGASIAEMAVKWSCVVNVLEVCFSHVPAPTPLVLICFLNSHTQLTVFHPECHGITPAELKSLPSIPCSQHNCAECNRNTAQSGGMLFRYVPKLVSSYSAPESVTCSRIDVRHVLRRSVKIVCHKVISTPLVTSCPSCTCKPVSLCVNVYSCIMLSQYIAGIWCTDDSLLHTLS